MTRSRSPKAVLYEAYVTAIQALPAYSPRCSPKKFTQHQLFACLVLKDFYGLSYRGVVGILIDCSDLREAIHLEQVPHFTASQPLLRPPPEDLGKTWAKTEGRLLPLP